MSETLKPIETVYNGYRFRSRLEARWAVMFDALRIKYEYEPEGFDCGDGQYYLPDFYLPNDDVWVEIKGQQPNESELKKIRAFCKAKADLTAGGSRFRLLQGQIPATQPITCLIYASPGELQKCVRGLQDEDALLNGALIAGIWLPGRSYDAVEKALSIARQARFEHGETPRIAGGK